MWNLNNCWNSIRYFVKTYVSWEGLRILLEITKTFLEKFRGFLKKLSFALFEFTTRTINFISESPLRRVLRVTLHIIILFWVFFAQNIEILKNTFISKIKIIKQNGISEDVLKQIVNKIIFYLSLIIITNLITLYLCYGEICFVIVWDAPRWLLLFLIIFSFAFCDYTVSNIYVFWNLTFLKKMEKLQQYAKYVLQEKFTTKYLSDQANGVMFFWNALTWVCVFKPSCVDDVVYIMSFIYFNDYLRYIFAILVFSLYLLVYFYADKISFKKGFKPGIKSENDFVLSLRDNFSNKKHEIYKLCSDFWGPSLEYARKSGSCLDYFAAFLHDFWSIILLVISISCFVTGHYWWAIAVAYLGYNLEATDFINFLSTDFFAVFSSFIALFFKKIKFRCNSFIKGSLRLFLWFMWNLNKCWSSIRYFTKTYVNREGLRILLEITKTFLKSFRGFFKKLSFALFEFTMRTINFISESPLRRALRVTLHIIILFWVFFAQNIEILKNTFISKIKIIKQNGISEDVLKQIANKILFYLTLIFIVNLINLYLCYGEICFVIVWDAPRWLANTILFLIIFSFAFCDYTVSNIYIFWNLTFLKKMEKLQQYAKYVLQEKFTTKYLSDQANDVMFFWNALTLVCVFKPSCVDDVVEIMSFIYLNIYLRYIFAILVVSLYLLVYFYADKTSFKKSFKPGIKPENDFVLSLRDNFSNKKHETYKLCSDFWGPSLEYARKSGSCLDYFAAFLHDFWSIILLVISISCFVTGHYWWAIAVAYLSYNLEATDFINFLSTDFFAVFSSFIALFFKKIKFRCNFLIIFFTQLSNLRTTANLIRSYCLISVVATCVAFYMGYKFSDICVVHNDFLSIILAAIFVLSFLCCDWTFSEFNFLMLLYLFFKLNFVKILSKIKPFYLFLIYKFNFYKRIVITFFKKLFSLWRPLFKKCGYLYKFFKNFFK